MKLRYLAVAGIAVSIAAATTAYAAGLWSTLPIVGGAAYCASTVTGTGNLGGITGQGQGTIGSICGLNEPAGPATFAGTEMVPMDLLTPGTQSAGPQTSALANVTQFGVGPILTAQTATSTIPNGTPTYAIAAGTSATTTLPSAPIHGQIQRIVLGAAQTTAYTVAANTGQSCLPACPFTAPTLTAGTVYAWMYNAPTATWVKIQ